MLSSSIGNVILDGLFSLGATYISFPGSVYIGLFTTLPGVDGSGYAEPSDPNYLRVRIDTTSRITKESFLNGAVEGSVVSVDGDNALPVYVDNAGVIMFPETSIAYDVVGFGLFRTADTSSPDLPFLWGAVAAEEGGAVISVGSEEVPIIREGDFKITLV